MLNTLKRLFGRTPQQQTPERPNTPLEILMPEGRVQPEPPKIAGKVLSFLVASPQDTNTIELHGDDGHVHSTDSELRQFLALVAGAGQLNALVSHCRSIMFQLAENGKIGTLGCIQQGQLYSFSVVEHSPPPNLKWEFRRTIREVHE